MIRTLDSPAGVFAVEIVGDLDREDYDTVVLPGLQQLIDGTGEIRFVVLFGTAFAGIAESGSVTDAKHYVDEIVHGDLSKWKRCAVVTDIHWLRHSVALFRWMMPGEVATFGASDVHEAIAWAAE